MLELFFSGRPSPVDIPVSSTLKIRSHLSFSYTCLRLSKNLFTSDLLKPISRATLVDSGYRKHKVGLLDMNPWNQSSPAARLSTLNGCRNPFFYASSYANLHNCSLVMPKYNSFNLLAWSDSSFSNSAPSAGYRSVCPTMCSEDNSTQLSFIVNRLEAQTRTRKKKEKKITKKHKNTHTNMHRESVTRINHYAISLI